MSRANNINVALLSSLPKPYIDDRKASRKGACGMQQDGPSLGYDVDMVIRGARALPLRRTPPCQTPPCRAPHVHDTSVCLLAATEQSTSYLLSSPSFSPSHPNNPMVIMSGGYDARRALLGPRSVASASPPPATHGSRAGRDDQPLLPPSSPRRDIIHSSVVHVYPYVEKEIHVYFGTCVEQLVVN